jgi:hypothetical protein
LPRAFKQAIRVLNTILQAVPQLARLPLFPARGSQTSEETGMRALVGILALLSIAHVLCENRRGIDGRAVMGGTVATLVSAAIVGGAGAVRNRKKNPPGRLA